MLESSKSDYWHAVISAVYMEYAAGSTQLAVAKSLIHSAKYVHDVHCNATVTELIADAATSTCIKISLSIL
jgi:shikimate 5-dehydrogenase